MDKPDGTTRCAEDDCPMWKAEPKDPMPCRFWDYGYCVPDDLTEDNSCFCPDADYGHS